MSALLPPGLMDLGAVGQVLDVTGKTVSQYLSDSRPGGRYAEHPFPAPDRRIGKSPVWFKTRRQEIEKWSRQRAGRGQRQKTQAD